MSLPPVGTAGGLHPRRVAEGTPPSQRSCREEPSPPLILTFLRVAVTGLVGGCSGSRHDTRVVS